MDDNRTESVLEQPAISQSVIEAVLDTPIRHQWQPGQSGNLSGRPKTKPISDALRRMLDKPAEEMADYKPKTGAEEIAYAQYLEATKGKVKTFAANFITDRVEGKVVDHDDSRGNITFNVVVSAPRPTKQLDGDSS